MKSTATENTIIWTNNLIGPFGSISNRQKDIVTIDGQLDKAPNYLQTNINSNQIENL